MLKTKVRSLLNKKDRMMAARFLSKGEMVGIFNRGVCALWFDGGDPKAVKKMWKIKGEARRGRPIALTLNLKEFIPMIDVELLPSDLRNLILAPDFSSKVGSLCFIRAPIKATHQDLVPNHAKSFTSDGVCMIQNWDSFGHDSTGDFLNEVKKLGVKHPAVTSMNTTEQPEIVDQDLGESFCKEHGIPIFLKDPKAHPRHLGSYTIFTFGRKGIKLERDGNIPIRLFEKIFTLPIETEDARKPTYPQLKFPNRLFKNLTGAKVREVILLYLKGQIDV